MYKHYKKLIGFEFINLTEEQFNDEKEQQFLWYGFGAVMTEGNSDTIVLLPVQHIRFTQSPPLYYSNFSEYRVLEEKTIFTVQIKESIKNTSGFLWWKKTNIIETWVPIDEMGFAYHGNPIFKRLRSFNTLDAAFEVIKRLKSPTKIHYHNEQVSK